MTELKDKTVLITGASSGIGEATALKLAEAGAYVVVVARRKERLDKLAKQIKEDGGKALVIVADVTNRQTCEKVVKQTLKERKHLDIIINNAGVMLNGPVHNSPVEEWEQMISLNLLGLLYMTRAALEPIKKSHGHIVNVSSVAGRTTRPGSAVYNATKWGVNAFTDALRQELVADKTGVKTTLIEPGAVATELQTHLRPEIVKNWKKNFGNMTILEAEDIAEAIYYAVSQPQRVSVNEILIRPTEQQG